MTTPLKLPLLFGGCGRRPSALQRRRGRRALRNARQSGASRSTRWRGRHRSRRLPGGGSPMRVFLSGRQDLNLRPLGPQPSALPDCATPRGSCILPYLGLMSSRLDRRAVRGIAPRPIDEHLFVSLRCHAMRRCGRCHREKPFEEFAWRRKARGQRDNYCRPCRAVYKREHYAANRRRYIEPAQRRKKIVAANARVPRRFSSRTSCVDCGESDPVVLEFDHLRDKEFGIAQGLRDRDWQSVLDEMAKCEVVCANCHRRRTA